MSERVAVVGLGLIGGSVALRLSARGTRVHGFDPDPATRERAAARGIVVHETPGDWLAEADLVVVAVPLHVVGDVFAQIAPHLAATTTVIDVGSAQQVVHREARAHLGGARFVGAHPMAGTERSGFGAATPQLLVDAAWAVTVDDDSSPAAVHAVIALLLEHFSARVAVLDPETHDAVVAVVSHTPHVLANALLAGLAGSPHSRVAAALAAGSFRDGTRVAGHHALRTANMVRENRHEVAAELERVRDDLGDLVGLLRDGGSDAAVQAWFDRADEARVRLGGDEGSPREVATDAPVTELVRAGAEGWLIGGVAGGHFTLTRGGLGG